MQRADNRRRDDKSESRDFDIIINTVLNQAENPFLRRGKELLDKKKKNQEISTGKNETLGRQSRLKLPSPSSTSAKGGKEKASPINESTALGDTYVDQIQDWHSPHDAYDAMFEELLSLKGLVDRIEFKPVEAASPKRPREGEAEKFLCMAEDLLREAGGEMDQMLFGRRWKKRYPHMPVRPFLKDRYRAGASLARFFEETRRIKVCTTYSDGAVRRGACVFSVLDRCDCRSPFLPAAESAAARGAGWAGGDWRARAEVELRGMAYAGRMAAMREELRDLMLAVEEAMRRGGRLQ